MSLSELIAGVEDHEKRLIVFNAGDDAAADLRQQFSDRNVAVTAEETVSGRPGEFVTLSDEDGVIAAASLEQFTDRLARNDRPIGVEQSPYRPILDELDETMFTSWSIGQMMAATREIEDRAFRVGRGSLHAGFQTVSTLAGELDRYEQLGDGAVDVHAYAAPDEEPPETDNFTLHIERATEIEESWFVVFDGGGDDGQKCALLAEERAPREFYGFWTYDADTVDWILEHLRSTYGYVEQ
ncbi:histidine kinase [Halomicrobium sp. IBSBa]|uniref:Histidine kinase n=1 Tax=Halomicrobium mukohataei TaxID=57705 RepID=A0A847UAM1_9EURY|nr:MULTISPECIES: DICT sensory domain-containing protein [Halomicrobium]MBO4248164.1 histidine kinase [Halomicrobium sp. IBSBa]NLV10455.1 histidine kinase [Halomicrobium mukohataei]